MKKTYAQAVASIKLDHSYSEIETNVDHYYCKKPKSETLSLSKTSSAPSNKNDHSGCSDIKRIKLDICSGSEGNSADKVDSDHSYCKQLQMSSNLEAKIPPQVEFHAPAESNLVCLPSEITTKHSDHSYCKQLQMSSNLEAKIPPQVEFHAPAESNLVCLPSEITTKHTEIVSDTISLGKDLFKVENEIYEVQDVQADGSCFFHALALALSYNNQCTGVDLRKQICSKIYDMFENWRHEIVIHHDSCPDRHAYKQKMLLRPGWATVAEIKSATLLLDISMTIFMTTMIPNKILKSTYKSTPSPNANVCLLLHNNHFQLLKRKPQTKSKQNKSNTPVSSLKQENTVNHFKHTKKTNQLETLSKTPSLLANKQSIFENEKACKNTKYFTYNVSEIQKSNTQKLPRKTKATTTTQSENLKNKLRKVGLQHDTLPQSKNEEKILLQKVKYRLDKFDISLESIPEAPPVLENEQANLAMDCVRSFELHQMAYKFNLCNVCNERRLEGSIHDQHTCKRCLKDKNDTKMFSNENNMDPLEVPPELEGLTMIEQQLISRISPCINVHMLKHGGLSSSGHCITFPQEVNEPAKIFPRLPSEVHIVRVRKAGKNDSSKDFRVRRYVIQTALSWLKANNPVFSDIEISLERLNMLPVDGEITEVHTVEFSDNAKHTDDLGPAPDQLNPVTDEVCPDTSSCALLQPEHNDINQSKDDFLNSIISSDKKKNTVTLPWPTRDSHPVSEFTTRNFFTLAFPTLFPYAKGDFFANRKRTCNSMPDWASHLLWYKDGRFAKHLIFKFIVHNMIIRKRSVENSNFVVKQLLGDQHLSVTELKEQLEAGDKSFAEKVLHFGAKIKGTSQYWIQRRKELRALIQYKLNEGHGLPSFFATGSCAEFYFKPLKRLLQIYLKETTGKDVDLDNKSNMFEALQQNTHVISDYFEKRTTCYFKEVLGPVFGVDTYWYRYEFAKSRGMVHWHALCWRKDREPHNLLYEEFQNGENLHSIAQNLSSWAEKQFNLTASHPAGKDEFGNSRKDLWIPPEGTAVQPPEECNPLLKLLMDVSQSQSSILEDYILLCNKINIHRCSDYCQRKSGKQDKKCRLDFGSLKTPGKKIHCEPEIIKDKNGCLRLEMARDHPSLVQHSQYHTQGWRANGDISIILSKSDPSNPSVDDIVAAEDYISGYACKGGQSTGALVDLFSDLVNSTENTDVKSICTKLLMNTTRRDISSVEAAFELSCLPLYRCSLQFQNVSLSGVRVLEKNGKTLTKQTSLDKYLCRDKQDTSSWYSFVCNKRYVPVISGGMYKCTWPPSEDYCRTMLLLHYPNWRNILDIKGSSVSWHDNFMSFLNNPACPNFIKADIMKAQKGIPQAEFEADNSVNDVDEANVPEWAELVRPNSEFNAEDNFEYDDGGPDHDWTHTRLSYPNGLGVGFLTEINEIKQSVVNDFSNVSIFNLNLEQKFAFDLVIDTVLNYKSNLSNYEPMRMIVTGTAGSGKSFLIKCLVKALTIIYGNSQCCQVLCPTGNAANLLSGLTIHSFLRIPTSGKNNDMCPPKGRAAEELQTNFRNLDVLLIDERSLIGCNTMGWMEYMCRFARQSDLSWGGHPVVVFFGDDVQLPPVLDSPVYLPNGKSPASMHGALVWKEFTCAVALKTVVRQDFTQHQLKQTLKSLSMYQLTSQQAEWLQTFQWNELRLSRGDNFLRQLEQNALFVFPTHAEEWEHNKLKILNANKVHPIAKIKAINQGSHAISFASDKANGLLKELFICTGAKVMLTCNLLVKYGLFNGSTGEVTDIIYPEGQNPSTSLPLVVMVEFDKYSGPPFHPEHTKIVPICPVKKKIECPCNSCFRTQIPLRLGWGTTVHRCQGMTIGKNECFRYIVINPGSNSFESRNPGALFVALSRAKSAGDDKEEPDFAWHPSVILNEDRLCHVVKTATTKARFQEIKRINQLAAETHNKYSKIISNSCTLKKF